MIDVPKLVMSDKERAQRAALKRAVRPKRAATIVLTCGDPENPRILMGQRASRSDFMPSVFVFPGGRVDRADNYAPYVGRLSARTERILEAAYPPRQARSLIMTAIRETWEETGLMLGAEEAWRKNLTHPTWDEFREAGMQPDLNGIEVFGRAITPPHRHKRFDTWFFIKRLDCETPPEASDSTELLNVDWFTFDQIRDLKKHRATDMMLQVLQSYLAADRPPEDIFFSQMVRGQFHMGRFPNG